MSSRDFYKLLVFTGCISSISILLLHWGFPSVQFNSPIAWWGLAFFVVLSVSMYYLGKRSLGSPNKMMFTNVATMFMFGKMFLSVIILFIYKQTINPTSGNFVLPFVVVYLFFAVFETYFMVKVGSK
jgi:hypothetical protein